MSISPLPTQAHKLKRKHTLGRDITITLVVKIAVIYALWYVFFSDPIDDTLTGPQVGNVLFGTPQPDKAPIDQTVFDQTSLSEQSFNPQKSSLEIPSIKGEKQ